MDNISEARTEIESIVAPPSNNNTATAAVIVATSISQEPIFDGDDENGDVNVSAFFVLFSQRIDSTNDVLEEWVRRIMFSNKQICDKF